MQINYKAKDSEIRRMYSPEFKEVVYFADRFWYVLELKLNTIMQKSNNHLEADMFIIRIQGQIQDIILNNKFYISFGLSAKDG